jgi:transcription termination factor NusA
MEAIVSKEIIDALRQIEKEKGIAFEALIEALEDALLSAYKKTTHAVEHAKVEVDTETGDMRVYELIFPEHIDVEALKVHDEEGEEIGLDLSSVDMSEVERIEVTPDDFGRIAAQTAKQVILQRIREAERDLMYEEYIDRVGELVTGIVQQSDPRHNTLVELGRVEAELPRGEQIETEHYDHGARIKAVIMRVEDSAKGPQVKLSRRSDEIVRQLFELEVPEIADGLVEIKQIARETGYRGRDGKPVPGRCKIAVISHADGVDPVGACVGPRGSRVRMVVSELRGERIDIIPYARSSSTTKRRPRPSSCPTTSCRWPSAKRARTPASRASSPAGVSTSRVSSRWPKPRTTWSSATTRVWTASAWPSDAPASAAPTRRSRDRGTAESTSTMSPPSRSPRPSLWWPTKPRRRPARSDRGAGARTNLHRLPPQARPGRAGPTH